jgi:small subunit ribosomal protein S2
MSQKTEQEDIKKKVLSTGIRVGTAIKTKFMLPFITNTSPEGLYILDLDIIVKRINTAVTFVKKFDISRVIVCSGRAYAKTPIEKFCEVTGAKMMFGRFMPGTLTNPSLPFYTEPHLVIISDPQVDSQAITEATNAGIPVIGIANTDNVTSKLDLVVPANNRGRKALATVYWLLARGILEDSDAMTYEIDDFETKTSEVEEEL